LYTLKSWHISDLLLCLIDKLVTSITKLSESGLIFLSAISFNIELPFYSFSNTHWTWNIKTENYRNILSTHFFVNYLRGSLNEIGYCFSFRFFFFIHNLNFVNKVTEFAFPLLMITYHALIYHGFVIKNTCAPFTYLSISSCDFCLIIKTIKGNLKDVCIDFNVVFVRFSFHTLLFTLYSFWLFDILTLYKVILLVW